MKSTSLTLEILFKNGKESPSKLSRLTRTPLRTVNRILVKIRKGKTLERKKGSGRPQKFSANDKRRLIQLVRKDDKKTLLDLKIKMSQKGSPEVCQKTILSYLNRSHYYKFLPKETLNLTPKHMGNRVKW